MSADDTPYTSASTFDDLPLSEDLKKVRAFELMRYRILCFLGASQLHAEATAFWVNNKLPYLIQGIYTEMKFDKPSRIQAKSLPMILTPPYRSLIAQVRRHQQHLSFPLLLR